MPEILEGKIKVIENKVSELDKHVSVLSQSVIDFHNTTDKTLAEIKTSLMRIESVMAVKVDKDAVDSLAKCKADNTTTNEIIKRQDLLENRMWWFVGIFATGFIALLIYLLEAHFK